MQPKPPYTPTRTFHIRIIPSCTVLTARSRQLVSVRAYRTRDTISRAEIVLVKPERALLTRLRSVFRVVARVAQRDVAFIAGPSQLARVTNNLVGVVRVVRGAVAMARLSVNSVGSRRNQGKNENREGDTSSYFVHVCGGVLGFTKSERWNGGLWKLVESGRNIGDLKKSG